MKVAVFSTKDYERDFLAAANARHEHELIFFEPRLTGKTVSLAGGFEAICVFVNDQLDTSTIEQLAQGGTRLIALRSAGFNNVDLVACEQQGITVARVPAYSPNAVAEHTVALLMTLIRHTHKAYNRVREGNFALDGLLGFDVHGRTVGIIGTGKIGYEFARLMKGFGCELLAYDPYPNPEVQKIGVQYLALPDLFARSDIISLHCPLTPQTHHIINADALAQMKRGVVLLNTSRGALVDTLDVIEGLKSGQVGYLGLDVYEEEADLFFEDLSNQVLQDDVFARLLTFPNVVITGHQAFFTQEAMQAIAETTLENITCFEQSGACKNVVTTAQIK